MGRRILAITLLIAFASPLAAPLFAATADPQASLPLCCRNHGAHRCTMMHRSVSGSRPAFHAPPCPFYPTATTAPRLLAASLAGPLTVSVQVRRDPAPCAPSLRHAARIFIASANLKRGPPTRLA
jgi:hypothetical protein